MNRTASTSYTYICDSKEMANKEIANFNLCYKYSDYIHVYITKLFINCSQAIYLPNFYCP